MLHVFSAIQANQLIINIQNQQKGSGGQTIAPQLHSSTDQATAAATLERGALDQPSTSANEARSSSQQAEISDQQAKTAAQAQTTTVAVTCTSALINQAKRFIIWLTKFIKDMLKK